VKHLGELFHDTSSWPTNEQVCFNHIEVERDPIRCLDRTVAFYFHKILYLDHLNAGLTVSFLPSLASKVTCRSWLSQSRPNLLVARPIATVPPELVPVRRGIKQASERPLPIQLLKRKPRKLHGNLWGESRSMNLYPQHPHRLLRRLPEKESQSFDRAGEPISSIFYY
jgi:hypothetical protein